MIVAIVIIGLGLAGVLLAFNTVVRSSADPMLQKQLLALAEQSIEEVYLQPYATGAGSISGCDRSNADDIFDYHGYDQAPCDLTGTAISELAAYRVAITVTAGATLNGVSSPEHARIVVTVSRGSEQLSLTTFRTNYGR